MLTMRRFCMLAESYGADLRRWPDKTRDHAQALLDVSVEARAILDAARALDDAIALHDAGRPPSWDEEAMLARLRAGVATQIAAGRSPARRLVWASAEWPLPFMLRWLGMATAGGLAITLGLVIGLTTARPPTPDGVLTLLHPAPITMLTD